MKKEYIHFRIEKELKEKAHAKAHKQNKTLTSIVCNFLKKFVKS